MSLSAPPRGHKALLSPNQASALVAYFARTFYAHYELHVYLHINNRAEEKVAKAVLIETPMPPVKMATGISQEAFDEKTRLDEEH